MSKTLSESGREQVALALILLKDFVAPSYAAADYIETVKKVFELADFLEVRPEFDRLMSKVLPMRIEPK